MSSITQLKQTVTTNVTQQSSGDRITGSEVRTTLNQLIDEIGIRGVKPVALITDLSTLDNTETNFIFVQAVDKLFKYTTVGTVDNIEIFQGSNGAKWKVVFDGNTVHFDQNIFSGDFSQSNPLTILFKTVGGQSILGTGNITVGSVGNLDSLTDVVITAPTNGQVLKWNGSNWVNSADISGSNLQQSPWIQNINGSQFNADNIKELEVKRLVGASQNLVLSSRDLSNATYWEQTSDITAQSTTEDGTLGVDTLYLLTGGNGGSNNTQQDVTVVPNTTYHLYMDVRRGTSPVHFISIRDQISFLDIMPLTDIYSLTSNTVQRLHFEFTTPAACTSIRLYTARNINGTVYVGDVQLTTTLGMPYVVTTTAPITNIGTITEGLNVDSSANVAIGKSKGSALDKLDVVGNIRFSGALRPAGNGGTAGQVLKSTGPNTVPSWEDNTYTSFNLLSTSDATPTTILTIPMAAGKISTIELTMVAVMQGSSGSFVYGKKLITVHSTDGNNVVTDFSSDIIPVNRIGSFTTATWSVTSVLGDLLVNVTGEAATFIDWKVDFKEVEIGAAL